MIVLGIETSCDETSAAVLDGGKVRSNIISSQLIHSEFGGVVPELASRAHLRLITRVVDGALKHAGVSKGELNAVAATQGPGLAGALLVGLSFGKALAFGLGIPFAGVNHMEGHLYSNMLSENPPEYPFLSLIVSGGHTMLVHVTGPFRHQVLGQTRDDAAGEAFDKVSKMLGLGYPGGPVIDRRAREGNARAVVFPRAHLGEGYEFSFSGVKTAVLYHLRRNRLPDPSLHGNAEYESTVNDICAGFQEAVVEVLVGKTIRAAREIGVRDIAVAGGVSANTRLRELLEAGARTHGNRLHTLPLEYCMDNAAMIGYVGWLQLREGKVTGLEVPAVANLELE